MKIWQWTIWTILVALFLLNQYIQRVLGIHIPFLYSYFDDLLAVPVTLGAYQFLITDILRKKHFRISFFMVLLCIIGFSFHFEVLMPYLSNKYTGDFIDIGMYAAGGVFYILILSNLISLKPFSHENLQLIFQRPGRR